MTEFTTKNFEPIDYCIEMSRMLEKKEEDIPKMINLFVHAFSSANSADVVKNYANEHDNRLRAFCQAIVSIHIYSEMRIDEAVTKCYQFFLKMPKEDMIIYDNDTPEEAERKKAKADAIATELFGRSPDEGKAEERKGFIQRILRLFSRN
jgi:hypothetical protein